LALAVTTSAVVANPAAPRLLLHDVTLIDGSGAGPRPRTDVLVAGARIAAVGPAGSLDARGSTVVNLAGRFLVPGFVDLHAHVMIHAWDEDGHVRPRWDRQGALEMLRLLLDHGVTTVRDPGAETEAAIALREELASGKVAGPTLFLAGRILNSSPFDAAPFLPVFTPEAVRREVRRQAAAGVDAIKVYASMPPPLVRTAIEEAHAHKLPVLGHLQATTWTEATRLGIDGLEHAAPWSRSYLPAAKQAAYPETLLGRIDWLEAVDLDGPQIRGLLDELVKHHVTVDPTLIAMWTKFFGDVARRGKDIPRTPAIYRAGWAAGSFTRGWSEADYHRAHAAWPKLQELVRRMWKRGVRITVGTDTPTPWIVPGASVHDEMALLRDIGLPALDVLRAATSNAACALGKSDVFGTVSPGKRADLVILARDPLADIHNTRSIERVYQAGVAVFPR
jgi:imidazolonepropionase-like amidohydrolase